MKELIAPFQAKYEMSIYDMVEWKLIFFLKIRLFFKKKRGGWEGEQTTWSHPVVVQGGELKQLL